MSDPLSVAGSAVGIISLGLQVTQSLYDYYRSVKDCEENIKQTARKLERLLGLLEQLDNHLKERRPTDHAAVQQIESNIQDCQESIDELQEKLKKFDKTPKTTFLASTKVVGRKALYPFRKGTLQSVEDDIDDIIPNVSLALQLLQQKATDNIQLDIEDIKSVLKQLRISQVSRDIQGWFKAPDASIEFNKACKKRHSGTGMWLIRGELFQNWIKKPGSFLWLTGFAGCGKSVLCSTAIHHMILHGRFRAKTGIAFFFFTFDGKNSASDMLRALILQLSDRLGDSSDVIQRLYRSYYNATPSDEVLLDYLHQLMMQFEDVYFLLDGLDESPRIRHRHAVLDILNEIRKEPMLHLLVTSRDEIDIREALQPLGEETISMRNDGIDADIANFVAQHLREDRRLRKWESDCDQIQRALTAKAGGVFRWVECQFEALIRCPDSQDFLGKALDSLPESLDETYERMLQNIDSISRDYARRMLTILCCAVRPLAVSELIDALAVKAGDDAGLDTKRRLKRGSDSLLELCPGFLEVILVDRWDIVKYEIQRGIPTIRLAHFSVQEYLESERILRNNAAFFAVNLQKAHVMMASVCLTLLLETPISTLTVEPQRDEEKIIYSQAQAISPLILYACEYWPLHLKVNLDDPNVESQVKKLLQVQSIAFRNWYAIAARKHLPFSYPYRDMGTTMRTTPLFWASALGLESIVAEICTAFPSSVNYICEDGHTALLVAARNGHEEVVHILLQNDANTDVVAGSKTALALASQEGSEAIVRMLLAKGTDVNAGDPTALHRASARGMERIVQILLDNGANINAISEMSKETALCSASRNGYEAVVRLLLDKGADINACGPSGTALCSALWMGQEAVVRLLLNKGADINACGPSGTALHAASQDGEEAVVRLLLDKGADINACGPSGTALHYASEEGEEAIVRLLLDKGADINACELNGTALYAASQGGEEAVVRLLLDKGADINACGPSGTALYHASEEGEEAIVRLLLDKGADINACELNGTALHAASDGAKPDIVRLLLEHNIDPTLLDKDARTALHVTKERVHRFPLSNDIKRQYEVVIRMLEDHARATSHSNSLQPETEDVVMEV